MQILHCTQLLKKSLFFAGFVALLSAVAIFSLLVGRYPVHLADVVCVLKSFFSAGAECDAVIGTVVVDIRLPRVLAAIFVGGALSVTGAAFQALFRNPMVSPSILGVSAGAGFGAALSIVLGLGIVLQQVVSFASGTLAVCIVLMLGAAAGKSYNRNLTLILAGMVVATVFSALLSVLKYIADPDTALPSIVYWLMGGLSDIQLSDLPFIGGLSLLGVAVLSYTGWQLDILSFGDDEARTIGIRVERLRFVVIIIAALMTSAAVSLSGIIGWVGLLIPHIARMCIGPHNTRLLPASYLLGGGFLLLVDDFSRSAFAVEIPLGITTSLIGAPFFIYILMKTAKNRNK